MAAVGESLEFRIGSVFCNVLDARRFEERLVFAETDERRNVNLWEGIPVIAD